MSHSYRKHAPTGGHEVRRNHGTAAFLEATPVGHCPECDKLLYASRKGAKRAAKIKHPTERMSAYPCPHQESATGGHLFHIGHKPPEVVRGKLSMAELRRATVDKEFRDRLDAQQRRQLAAECARPPRPEPQPIPLQRVPTPLEVAQRRSAIA